MYRKKENDIRIGRVDNSIDMKYKRISNVEIASSIYDRRQRGRHHYRRNLVGRNLQLKKGWLVADRGTRSRDGQGRGAPRQGACNSMVGQGEG